MKSVDGNRANDAIATYSSRGPTVGDHVLKPDLVAPGNKVISLDVNQSALDLAYNGTNQIPLSIYKSATGNNTLNSDRYFVLSGTSMAAPVVSGAAALLLQADPTLTPDTIKARLMVSATKLTAPNGTPDIATYGAGYVNIPSALDSKIVSTQPSTRSGERTPFGGPTSTTRQSSGTINGRNLASSDSLMPGCCLKVSSLGRDHLDIIPVFSRPRKRIPK